MRPGRHQALSLPGYHAGLPPEPWWFTTRTRLLLQRDVAEETGSAAGESSGDDTVSAEPTDETEANKTTEPEESEIDEATAEDASVADPTNETEEPDASGITDKDAGSVEPTDESKADEVRNSEKPEVEK